jgi:hypothetical protein
MPWPLIPVVIDIATEDDAGAWADAIANSPRLQASDYHTGSDGGTTPSPALAHCCDCDLWLQPHESCIHIPALPSVAPLIPQMQAVIAEADELRGVGA